MRFLLSQFDDRKLLLIILNEQMGCCGYSNWTDYEYLKLNITDFLPTKTTNRPPNNFYAQEYQTLVPFTCCKFPWVANLYCAKDSTEWFEALNGSSGNGSRAGANTEVEKYVEDRFYTTVSL